jgi:hypothetical protein
MKVIRGDIIGDQIKFNVDAQTYRQANTGFTRLDTVAKLAEQIGIEITDIESMQAIPAGDKYVIVLRSGVATDVRSKGVLPLSSSQGA